MVTIMRMLVFLIIATASVGAQDITDQPIKLASVPALSPDGKTMAFCWNGDIWTVPVKGGLAKRFTHNPAYDFRMAYSPDGNHLALTSKRNGRWNTFVAPAAGGEARQISFHSDGEQLLEWSADGTSVLYQAWRDQDGRHGQRLFLKTVDGTKPEKLLFDAQAADGRLSPDGKLIVFTREGGRVYRKGYLGTRSTQIWLYNIETKHYRKLIAETYGNRSPQWKADGSGLYYVSEKTGNFNLWECDLDGGYRKQLTFFKSDSVLFPAVSRDGSTIIFRHLFDFYRFYPGISKYPEKIDVRTNADIFAKDTVLKSFRKATAIAFTNDNLEIVLVAGGDLWVMDTVMKEPRRVVKSPHQVRDATFNKDHTAIIYTLDDGITSNVYQATRADEKKAWWENREFKLKQITAFKEPVSMVSFSNDGKKVIYCRGEGDLWLADAGFTNATKVMTSWNKPYYTWSADGTWLAFSVEDNHFNRDIWIMPVDGSRKPFNVSRSPKFDSSPAWSPDGNILAWTGQNMDDTQDIFYLYLTKDEAEESSRDRKLEKARKTMSARKKKTPTMTITSKPVPAEKTPVKQIAKKRPPKDAAMEVDFDRILERVRSIPTKGINEYGLLWAPDSKKIAFRNTVGKRGTYTMTFPDNLKPMFLNASTAYWWKWDSLGTTLYGMDKGVPVYLRGSKFTAIKFNCMMDISKENENRLLFNKIWRTMRDRFYREDMNGCNWPAIREKYLPMAMQVPDATSFQRVINLMLGELNASHTGFKPTRKRTTSEDAWRVHTAHVGLMFDPDYSGPGLKVSSIIPDSPIFLNKQKVTVGELVLKINGKDVDNNRDWLKALNGPKYQVIHLIVQDETGTTRDVSVVSTTYADLRKLLFKNHLRHLEKIVKEKSNERFAYIHVKSMDWSSFEKFQKDIFSRGFDSDGLVIDVRDNGGGFITDHLLTVLTQPQHAVTVPRGGGQGYPLRRSVYTYWHKPVIVLCNQNSFSNTEIFCHAIRTLKRGKIVGVQTAGCVISASAIPIDGKGTLRVPFRGWYRLDDGADMELNGATPDYIVWPEPGDLSQGKDRQLEKAIEVLLKETR